MNSVPAWIPLVSVLIGAIASGGIQTIVAYFDRNRERQSVLVAIASEVDTLCHLVRQRDYLGEISRLLRQIELGSVTDATYVIELRSDYFSVFNSLSGKLGSLPPNQVASIVRFYGYCKSLVDSTRPDGIASESQGQLHSVKALRALQAGIEAMLKLGDQVVQLPSRTLALPNDR